MQLELIMDCRGQKLWLESGLRKRDSPSRT
jgi:hypothetical protein